MKKTIKKSAPKKATKKDVKPVTKASPKLAIKAKAKTKAPKSYIHVDFAKKGNGFAVEIAGATRLQIAQVANSLMRSIEGIPA